MRTPTNYLPATELRDYILSYGILEIPASVDEPYFSPPIGLSGFIIHTVNTRNTIVAKIENRDHYTAEAVASGQVTCPVHGRHVGAARILMVFFHPLGMHELFGTDMATLTNTSMPLSDFLGAADAHELTTKLKANQDDRSQIRVLDEFFAARAEKSNESARRIRKVLEHIHLRKGSVSVQELEEFGHYEKKTLVRHFKRMVGITPKAYCKIYRFRCLMNLIQSRPDLTWAELTDQAGFYDQSHMSRSVRDYLRVPPSSIVRLNMKLINYLLTR